MVVCGAPNIIDSEKTGLVNTLFDIRYQQNLTGRKLPLVTLGSNIWPVVKNYSAAITARVDAATPGRYDFIEMPLPRRPPNP